MNTSQTPLWRQLEMVASLVAGVRRGRSLTVLLDGVEPALRPGVQALSFAVMRTLGRARALRARLARKSPPEAVDALLCTALALLVTPGEAGRASYEAFTLVDQAVEAAKRSPATRAQSGFINACLRRFLNDRAALLAETDRDPEARWNYPKWWIARVKADHPDAWQRILGAADQAAPLTLRVNGRRATVAGVLKKLDAAGIAAHAQGASAVVLERAVPVNALPGFAEGLVSVQDAGAQLAALLLLQGLEDGRPLKLLDACAAPGGKTAHLLERAQAQVTALDIDPRRCERIAANLRRLGLAATVVPADAAKPDTWWDGQAFDAILLDAPCTASGIVRRHPDVRWLRRESDVAQLAKLQAALLDALWPLLKTGGRLLYCTCSVFRAEGSEQTEAFVARHTDAHLTAAPGHLLPQFGADRDGVQDNWPGDHDGFYYALLEKRQPDRPGVLAGRCADTVWTVRDGLGAAAPA